MYTPSSPDPGYGPILIYFKSFDSVRTDGFRTGEIVISQ